MLIIFIFFKLLRSDLYCCLTFLFNIIFFFFFNFLIFKDEPGLAQDFFHQFVQRDPVSVRAKLAFVNGFPALLSTHQNVPKSSEVIKNLKISKIKKDETNNENKKKNKKGFSLFRSRKQRNRNSNSGGVIEEESSGWRDRLAPSFYLFAEKILVSWIGLKIEKNGKYKKKVENSLLITERETKIQEEVIATILIVFYLILLLILSLPPAMIKKGKKVVACVSRKIKKIQVAIKRTVSCTSLCTTSLCSASQSYRQSVQVSDLI